MTIKLKITASGQSPKDISEIVATDSQIFKIISNLWVCGKKIDTVCRGIKPKEI